MFCIALQSVRLKGVQSMMTEEQTFKRIWRAVLLQACSDIARYISLDTTIDAVDWLLFGDGKELADYFGFESCDRPSMVAWALAGMPGWKQERRRSSRRKNALKGGAVCHVD
jgi:hypothetical protein